MSAVSPLFDAPGPRARRRHAILTIVGVLVALGILGAATWKFQAQGQLEPALWTALFQPEVWSEYLVPGIFNTLKAAAISVALAGAFGIVFGMGRLSHSAPIRWVSGVVVEFFRAVPVLLMMYFTFFYYSINGIFTNEINPLAAVVTGLTLYNGSVIAELVRSGVYSLPAGQGEAGLSIGLTPGQTLRAIQLPQALTAMLPALVGQLVVVLKDSALGTAILYPELLQQAKDVGTAYGTVIPAYILAAVLFILINYALSLLAQRVEQRLRRRGAQTMHPGTTTTGGMPAVGAGMVHGEEDVAQR